MATSLLESIKQKLIGKKNEERRSKDERWISLVRRVASGENVSPNEIEPEIDSILSSTAPVCPINRDHGRGTFSLQNGGSSRKCNCTFCGHDWVEPVPAGEVGEYSVERFESEVELMKQRIVSRKNMDAGQKHEAELAKMEKRIQEAWERKIAAERAAKQLEQDLTEELAMTKHYIMVAGTSREMLQRTFGELYRPKQAEMDRIGVELRNIGDRLSYFRLNPSGTVDSHEFARAQETQRLKSEEQQLRNRLDSLQAQLLIP